MDKEWTSEVEGVAYSPDGTLLATASRDGAARVWDATTSQELTILVHRTPVVAVTFSPDGSLLATASGLMGKVWDLTAGRELARFKSIATS